VLAGHPQADEAVRLRWEGSAVGKTCHSRPRMSGPSARRWRRIVGNDASPEYWLSILLRSRKPLALARAPGVGGGGGGGAGGGAGGVVVGGVRGWV